MIVPPNSSKFSMIPWWFCDVLPFQFFHLACNSFIIFLFLHECEGVCIDGGRFFFFKMNGRVSVLMGKGECIVVSNFLFLVAFFSKPSLSLSCYL